MRRGRARGGRWAAGHRSPGGGDNLYLSSIQALRPENGELVWHYQTTPGDHWDFTATQHMILAELEIDGRERRVIMVRCCRLRSAGAYLLYTPVSRLRPKVRTCVDFIVEALRTEAVPTQN